jgi:predicted tellurium resistance membrane protein TerC
MLELATLDPSVLLTSHGIIALLTLTALEIVLGIDNIVFISIISNSLASEQDRRKARQLGLALAMITRVLLLLSLSWVMSLDRPFITVLDHPFSGRDMVLLVGGLFLLYKATVEIRAKVMGHDHGDNGGGKKARTLGGVIAQIILIDLVFSLDSVITAVGMSNEIIIMVAAVMIAVAVMMLAAGAISDFVEKHATVKMLALAFLVMIGMALITEGMGEHINKNYIYFAMGFSVAVEMLNLRMMRNRLLKGTGSDGRP